jgi:hypothetical protein
LWSGLITITSVFPIVSKEKPISFQAFELIPRSSAKFKKPVFCLIVFWLKPLISEVSFLALALLMVAEDLDVA